MAFQTAYGTSSSGYFMSKKTGRHLHRDKTISDTHFDETAKGHDHPDGPKWRK